MNGLNPCPICNSTRDIEKVIHVFPNSICNVNLRCDRCGFHAPRAITVRGAGRRWNKYVTNWLEGFEAVEPIIEKGTEGSYAGKKM